MKKNQNDEETDGSNSILSTLLAESFRHWRHIENLRQGFTTIWAAIVAGVLTFLSQTENFLENPASIPILVFLLLVTGLGLLVSVRLSSNIKPCEDNIKRILKSVELDKYDPTKGWGKGITKYFRLRWIYIGAYVVALSFLVYLIWSVYVSVHRN